jgi:hypothetical protein
MRDRSPSPEADDSEQQEVAYTCSSESACKRIARFRAIHFDTRYQLAISKKRSLEAEMQVDFVRIA